VPAVLVGGIRARIIHHDSAGSARRPSLPGLQAACKKPLVLKENPPSLKCGECRRVYPIQDGIPILLIDAASIDAA